MKIYLLALVLLLGGCAPYAKTEIGFWDQKVSVTGWGINLVSAYGVLNAGYIQYSRNTDAPTAQPGPASMLKSTVP